MERTKLDDTLFREDYHHHFSPVGFLDGYWKDLQPLGVQFVLDQTYAYMQNVPTSGSRFLDLGCGPNFAVVIAAPDHFNHMVMADFTESNRETIRRYLRGEDVGFNWNHVCQYYIDNNNLNSDWGHQRLASLKRNIKETKACDVLQPDPLGQEYRKYFDCVASSFCLEVASRDFETYCRSVKNVASLIKDGGFLILRGSLEQTNYPINDKVFQTLPLTWDQLMTSQQDAGFKVMKSSTHPSGEEMGGAFYCLLSKKVV